MTYKLTYLESMDVIGGLSTPSKMPWYGWSTSAYDCITGSKLRKVEGSVCEDCYACKGQYCFKTTRIAHDRRMNCLADPRFVEAFILVLTKLHERGRKTYTVNGVEVKENRFRWHDSGDLQSVQHLQMIVDIAKGTPQITHWLPTREFGMVSEWIKQNGEFPANLVVRMSAPMKGQTFNHQPMGLAFSTVGLSEEMMLLSDIKQCNARETDNKCGDCTQCWNKNNNINYPLH